MNYNFLEKNLGDDFCQEQTSYAKSLVEASVDFTLVGLPGVGATTFFKYLVCQKDACYIYLNLMLLPKLTKLDFYQYLFEELGGKVKTKDPAQILQQTKDLLKKLTAEGKKAVIVLNHFFKLGNQIDRELMAYLDSLRNIDIKQVLFIFHSLKPWVEVVSEEIKQSHLNLLAKTIYFKPYSAKNLNKISQILSIDPFIDKKYLEKSLILSGGHCLLLRLLLKTQFQSDPLLDPAISLQLREIINNFSYQDQKTLGNIAQGKAVPQIHPLLLDLGLVQETANGFQLFTPLLEEFLNKNQTLKLSQNESRLFRLLKKNLGRVVSKDQIFTEVWDGNEEASDWALNSIIYRLRKNPIFRQQSYFIESHKKLGYSLNKSGYQFPLRMKREDKI